MFTGLIQALGTLQPIGAEQVRILWTSPITEPTLQDIARGDSIAVDGVCLTVTEILPQGFVATVSPETIARTTLGHQSNMSHVNLETSLRVGSKLGGHFVTGHVDGVGYLQSAAQTARSWEMEFTTASEAVARYIVPKGSIAINGISLTIAECSTDGRWFKVAVIPHTYTMTNLHELQPGSLVNLEGDILGKYVDKLISYRPDRDTESLHPESLQTFYSSSVPDSLSQANQTMGQTVSQTGITPEFLTEHGYL
ncbi:MAG: riboflavin synthase [Leptolyngbyaceae cyanobacterium bins.59]|nr:riboflavin synthase [Leptolyngbyaceae cyanobacterium bins.59]